MYPTQNSLPENLRIQVSALLQEHLCNSLDLASQAEQAHWNVKGPDFISLHELFDKIAEESEVYADLIAERIVQLGGIAAGTLRMAARHTQLPEFPLKIAAGHEHVAALAHTLASYGVNVRRVIAQASELRDPDTADIFTQISREVDKNLWFVEAHLQGAR